MLKIGICTESDDTPLQRIWRRGGVSASLLTSASTARESQQDRFERLMPHLCLSNGVARTTLRGRFTELNDLVQRTIAGVFTPGDPITVEDWAVSSGITAVEWFVRLKADYPDVRFTASDKVLYLIEVRDAPSGQTFILEPDGTPIQYIRRPFVINLVHEQHPVFVVNRILRRRAVQRWGALRTAVALPAWRGLDGSSEPVKSGTFLLSRLPLLHPEVLSERSEQFRIREHSVFEALAAPVHMVRTMNILNLAYFSADTILSAVAAVRKSIRPAGLWLVGRTIAENPFLHDATLFRKQDSGWDVVLRCGAGSEIESLVQAASRTEV